MSTLHGFYRVLSRVLATLTTMLLLSPTVGHAQSQPVIVTITELQQLGENFDPTSLGD